MKFAFHSLLLAVAMLLVTSVASAQLKMNNITVVTSAPAPTTKNVVSQPGASVTFRNDFTTSVIVRITNLDTGEVLAEETIEPGTETHNHGQGVGNYQIEVAEAGENPTYQDAGKLVVVSTDG